MKSIRLAVYCMATALALAACAAGKPAWTGDPELARNLTLKMSEAEVRELLGEPSTTGELNLGSVKTTYWDYNGSKNVRVVMTNGKVSAVVLDRVIIIEASASDI